MLEVCSTTLPQMALPRIVSHPEYWPYLNERISRYEKYSNIAYDCLKKVTGLRVNRTNGAFYMSVAFQDGILNHRQTLAIGNEKVKSHVEGLVNQPGVELDKRFVYYLLGATGICVVPLSSFATTMQGFRTTILERDEAKFRMIFQNLADSIGRYLASA
jgi:aspartate/methionine/tyrosine aminotransferase